MTINIQELFDKGYKEFPPTRFDTADRCFQKRFMSESGDTLYFININMYYSWGSVPENFEVVDDGLSTEAEKFNRLIDIAIKEYDGLYTNEIDFFVEFLRKKIMEVSK